MVVNRSNQEWIKNKGDGRMSILLAELKGKKCVLWIEGALNVKGEVIGMDERWMKCRLTEKKQAGKYMLYRIDTVRKIEILD